MKYSLTKNKLPKLRVRRSEVEKIEERERQTTLTFRYFRSLTIRGTRASFALSRFSTYQVRGKGQDSDLYIIP